MKVLITGGAGFIGSHIAELFSRRGHRVCILDDYSTGSRETAKRLMDTYPTLSRFTANIASDEFLSNWQKLGEPNLDCIVHLAAKASIVPSIKNPELYHRINVGGTMNVFHLAQKLGVRKFIYAASGSCYGIPKEIPTTEHCPIQPQYPYAQTKYDAEQHALKFCETNSISFVSLRLFNVFGPRMCLKGGYGGLFSAILPQKFNNAEVVTIGNGEQSRDFVFANDVAQAFLLVAESELQRGIFNIGGGEPVSVNTILRLLEIPESQVFRLPARPGEPHKTQADISRIWKVLGWKPETSFAAGLQAMIADAEYWRRAKVWTRQESINSQKEWYAHFGQPIA